MKEIISQLKNKYEIYKIDNFCITKVQINEQVERIKFYHKHQNYEFLIPLTPISGILFQNKAYLGEPYMVYPISPYREHGIEADLTNIKYIDINISNKFFNNVLTNLGKNKNTEFNYEFTYSKVLENYIKIFQEIYITNTEFRKLEIGNIAQLICIELINSRFSTKKRYKKKEFYKRYKNVRNCELSCNKLL